ncbi:class I SAM-dependent methyltransferase [Desulfogranum mediterraneum]|uniref:class I SAM-dependent methyltransferase n=1 Tax=Desulfogranum mediterraneum TaxID=160661 RepID=UPI000417E37B|nr:class I SAM-dependent methyltransferase [Desulfogranum mediterraneum]
MPSALFDSWTERYDRWFTTPAGRLIKKYEAALLLELLQPLPNEQILDVGCGSGIFTQDVLESGAAVTGIDLSLPMLQRAIARTAGCPFSGLCGDMTALPFADDSFDRVFSMTAIEFVADAARVTAELERVTRRGGTVVVTTLNSLSPWAEQRRRKAEQGHGLFQNIFFRSPEELRAIVKEKSVIRSAIHFQKDAPLATIPELEQRGRMHRSEQGAFLAIQWTKA